MCVCACVCVCVGGGGLYGCHGVVARCGVHYRAVRTEYYVFLKRARWLVLLVQCTRLHHIRVPSLLTLIDYRTYAVSW